MIPIRTRLLDQKRATRLMLATLTDNSPAIELVIAETADDDSGPNGLVFALLAIAATLAEQTSDAVRSIEAALLELDQRADDDG